MASTDLQRYVDEQRLLLDDLQEARTREEIVTTFVRRMRELSEFDRDVKAQVAHGIVYRSARSKGATHVAASDLATVVASRVKGELP
jgi:hypothetical protein